MNDAVVSPETMSGWPVMETGVPPLIGQVGRVPHAPLTVWSTTAQLS